MNHFSLSSTLDLPSFQVPPLQPTVSLDPFRLSVDFHEMCFRSNLSDVFAEWPRWKQCLAHVFSYVTDVFSSVASIFSQFSRLQTIGKSIGVFLVTLSHVAPVQVGVLPSSRLSPLCSVLVQHRPRILPLNRLPDTGLCSPSERERESVDCSFSPTSPIYSPNIGSPRYR